MYKLKPGQIMSMKEAMELADDNLTEGAYWQQVHEIAGLEYGEGFEELEEVAAISAISNSLQEIKPKVKQLRWINHLDALGGVVVYAHGYMDSKNDIDIVYEIHKHTDQSTMQGYSVLTPTDDDHNAYATLEEAKAAAQSHFEALILGCLED